MSKFFNTAGFCIPEDHYMVNPLQRLKEIESLIDSKFYFTIHAPRQTGKTTYLHSLARKLNSEGKYIAVVVSFERVGFQGITVEKANSTLIDSVYQASFEQIPEIDRPENPQGKEYVDLKMYLQTWSRSKTKPIVLFIDEIDALLDSVLISVLRQLRDGYQSRPKHFPSSIALVGLRDIREYKAMIRDNQRSMGTPSPFNIKSDSLILSNFKKEEVFELLEQHTRETGQEFPIEVKEEIFRLSQGQPWLTNALARQIVEKILEKDYSRKITLEILHEAKHQLILRRDTHLDSLIDKLKEDRVKKIVQAIINGDVLPFDVLDDDTLYVRDLGIITPTAPLKFANPIYAEIIPRVMASSIQDSFSEEIQTRCFVKASNKYELDMPRLFAAFQEFYSENAEAWMERFMFKESAHHLLIMAFLQRIINSGGEIIREMAVGNGRVDLLVKFYNQRTAIELKIKRGEKSIEKAKMQLSRYLDKLGLSEGYLVIFDPADIPWEDKLYFDEIEYKGKKLFMVGV